MYVCVVICVVGFCWVDGWFGFDVGIVVCGGFCYVLELVDVFGWFCCFDWCWY